MSVSSGARGRGRTVAVIGASGSVGRQVCTAFAARGARVVAVARRHAAHMAAYDFHALDVTGTDPADLAMMLRACGVDVVVNAAGRWGPTHEEMVHSHSALVTRLLVALGRLDTRPRLVHVGSIHEYGPVPAGTLIAETHLPRPANDYARAKLAATAAVLAANQAGRVEAVVLRASNMFGPYPPQETFLASLLRQLRQTPTSQPLDVTVATARRDFVDVRDFADAVVLAATVAQPPNLLNIGRGVALDMGELVALVLQIARWPAQRLRMTRAEVPSLGGDWTAVDTRLAAARLGWQPRRSVHESVQAMWDASDKLSPSGR